jgi:hypothetical protein
LTEYFEKQHDTSDDTKESTSRHKHLNKTLAQAYDVLFPATQVTSSSPRKQKASVRTVKAGPPANTNRFQTFSDMIKQEHGETGIDPAFFNRSADDAAPTSKFMFQDDALEEPLALQTYVLQVEKLSIWPMETSHPRDRRIDQPRVSAD